MSDTSRPADPAAPRIMSGEAWADLCDTIRRGERFVLGEGVLATPAARAEGFRYLTRFLQAGIVSCVAHDDADYPVLGRMMDYTMPWGLDNPDCLYLYAPIRGDATYRLWGNRGSANHIDIQANAGHYANGVIADWRTMDSIDGFELETDRDGAFELTLSHERQPGNWLKLDPDAGFLLIRQYMNDWENERPADLTIERVGASYPIPSPRTDFVEARLDKLSRWLDKGASLWENMSRGFLSMEPNSLLVHMPEDAGERSGMQGQAYGMGNFHCDEEEAVVIEFEPPQCHHWGVALANEYWECIEFGSRQASINGSQARLDADGIFRAVISHRDPGVPNWLDPAGHSRGTLTARFLRAESAPKIQFQRVLSADVSRVLHPETPKVSPEQRSTMLRSRYLSVLRRYRR